MHAPSNPQPTTDPVRPALARARQAGGCASRIAQTSVCLRTRTRTALHPTDFDGCLESSHRRGQEADASLHGPLPMPKLEPIEPKIYGKIKLDGYTIEKAIFETLQGFYVTGNLYRPDPMPAGKVPGVLCPHGHWA